MAFLKNLNFSNLQVLDLGVLDDDAELFFLLTSFLFKDGFNIKGEKLFALSDKA